MYSLFEVAFFILYFVVKAIRFIIWAEPKKIFSFEISEEAKLKLKLLSKVYLDKCLEREYN